MYIRGKFIHTSIIPVCIHHPVWQLWSVCHLLPSINAVNFFDSHLWLGLLHPGKLTWQWKTNHLKMIISMYLLLKLWFSIVMLVFGGGYNSTKYPQQSTGKNPKGPPFFIHALSAISMWEQPGTAATPLPKSLSEYPSKRDHVRLGTQDEGDTRIHSWHLASAFQTNSLSVSESLFAKSVFA